MSIKKAELHVHLEGTMSPVLASDIAKRHGLTLPHGLLTDDGLGYYSKDFLHFLSVYDTLANLIKSPRDYYDMTYDYLKNAAKSDVIYVEMMYSPDHAEQSSGIASIEHLHALQQAIDDAKAHYNIVGRIIMTAVRQFGTKAVERVAQHAITTSLPSVVGFGLGGDELHFPPQDFKRAFHMAHEAGLQCTVHAGEFAPASSIWDAITHLPVQRIGHGVHAMSDVILMRELKERNIALELCPTSNIQFGLFQNIHQHPLPTFLKAGINISINSDDPPFMKTNVAREYHLVQKAFDYTDDTMLSITKMAIESAFVDPKTKQQLLNELHAEEALV